MIIIDTHYTSKYPTIFKGIQVGDRVEHVILGPATVTKILSYRWFVVEFDNPKLHRDTVNIEGSTFNCNPPIFKKEN